MMKIALVSTFINAAPVLASWLERHRQLGISQFYLFTDTPAETGRYAAHTAPDILWTPRDDALISRWQALPSWDEYAPYCEGEWYARQCLNADLAFNQAKADGCDWLIHLDIDEELYAPGARSLAETLVAHAGNDLLHFANHEAIPEAWHIDDYFRDVTLFKKHHEVLTEPQRLLAMKHFGTSITSPMAMARRQPTCMAQPDARRAHTGSSPAFRRRARAISACCIFPIAASTGFTRSF